MRVGWYIYQCMNRRVDDIRKGNGMNTAFGFSLEVVYIHVPHFVNLCSAEWYALMGP